MENHNKKEKAYLEPMKVWPYKRTCDWKYKKMMRMAGTKGDGLYAAAWRACTARCRPTCWPHFWIMWLLYRAKMVCSV